MINPAMLFKYKQHAWMLLLAILCLFATVSCQHKDLCIHHPHEVTLRVEFDWRNDPDANPQGMCVFFYPVEGGESIRFDFSGREGGNIELPVGLYNVLTYNNDTESILFGNGSFEKHRAYTREGNILEPVLGSSAGAPRATGTEEEKVVITPDMLWGCTSLNVEVTDTGIGYICIPEKDKDNYVQVDRQEHVITLYPCEKMCLYSYEIRNVKNLDMASQMCASLSGMAGGMTLADEELFTRGVTLPLDANIQLDSAKITGIFYTFGHSLENSAPHKMLLYVWMKSGDKFYFGEGNERFNVTSQIHNAPNKRRVHIIIDSLDLPKPMQNGSGFNPSVDDWDTLYEDIIVGY